MVNVVAKAKTPKSPIEQEIKWCLSHRGVSGKGAVYENAFIAGLNQALRLQQSYKCQRPKLKK